MGVSAFELCAPRETSAPPCRGQLPIQATGREVGMQDGGLQAVAAVKSGGRQSVLEQDRL